MIVLKQFYNIEMIKVLLYLWLGLFTFSSGFYCDTPQRVGYMSYSTLIDYDNLTGLFQTMDTQINKSQCPVVVSQNATYTLSNIQPHVYYLDSKQNITFLDVYTANVTGGDLYFHLVFNYQIKYQNGSSLKGTATTINRLQDFWFTKALVNEKGELLWKINQVNALIVNDTLTIETSSPKLPFDDKQQIESILNGEGQTQCNVKTKSMSQINALYFADLESWFVNEHLLSSTNIIYKYSFDKSLEYMNHPYEFGLNQKGLEYEFLFQVDQYTTECAKLNTTFLEQYGGNQQKIAMTQIKASALKMVKEGWMFRQMTFEWEIPELQFYMGDLGNYMEKARQSTPFKPFEVGCVSNSSLYDILVEKHEKNQIYVTIPYLCTFTLDNDQIQQLVFNAGLLITITANSEHLVFKIAATGAMSPVFTSIDDYKITSFSYATQVLKRMIASTIGSKTYGTLFPINFRDRPAIVVEDEYVLVYDAAEPY